MNIPMSWINEFVPLEGVDIDDYMHRLTMIGQKVEGVELVADDITNVVVGRIDKIEKHSGADKLSVAAVDVGSGKVVTIVTGATNISEGDLVPIALDGANLANGLKIKSGEIRGIASEGMMCSIEELGFTRNDFPEAPENGIYIFRHEGLKAGDDALSALDLKQAVVEYEITSNRPDCFSVLGIAREAAAAYKKPLTTPAYTPKEAAGGNAADMVSIEIKNAELCPRYAARIVKNVKIEPSPQWLRRRLTSAGIRPINNIVDITNYVMLEFGQPMHAFDLSEVEGGIIVRNADDGEMFTTLDGIDRKLDSSMLVIADHKKALAIAGVMGGENSKITGGAGAVLFESACFNGTNVRLTSKKLGLRTDASSKFEKGLDPNLAEIAVDRAVYLVEALNAGEVVEGIADCYPQKREVREISFEPDKINKLIGFNLTDSEMADLIKPFGIEIDGKKAIIPTFRPDLEITADLAEEVARAYGYDRLSPEMIKAAPTVGKKTYEQRVSDIIKEAFVSFGFYEAITYSFESPDVFDKLLMPKESELRKAINILNPLGENYGIMRTTPINSMLQSLSINYNKRNAMALLFETANVYLADELPIKALPNEESMLVAGLYGKAIDFYTTKGYVESLFDVLGIKNADFIPTASISYLHPGRAAEILIGGEKIGSLGEVHPLVLENYSVGEKAYVIEIKMKSLYENAVIVRSYKELPKFPSVQRDVALLVSDDIMVSELTKTIYEKGTDLLKEVVLFDVYKGEQVGEGEKSVAFSLLFRSAEKTLTEGEINPIMSTIVNELENRFAAKLRG